ncbi:hypothetical protein PBI_GAIA_60 [Mycobacterium phage Gaia]|uniref:Uncharacterized protein n=1 Tax=Mycobacterium phage Gaia TaxID=1486472 RepID=A0A068F2F6_9CAUD|nr:hypothetical protein VC46_gp173 [Mycobacterium phage Gaia]AID58879.1 hypothetical protein PBI_GAIA_60 [Mycobacterium phage Gaia]AYR00001.1 hypothetical protein PBI_NEBKISS_61 [Mycobacterium phage Nebkiss]
MSSHKWRVGKWPLGGCMDKPWYAVDRGGWFGKGLPGHSFKTHGEAMAYVDRVVKAIEEAKS